LGQAVRVCDFGSDDYFFQAIAFANFHVETGIFFEVQVESFSFITYVGKANLVFSSGQRERVKIVFVGRRALADCRDANARVEQFFAGSRIAQVAGKGTV